MINAADTAWILVLAALVLMMTFEGGSSYTIAPKISV